MAKQSKRQQAIAKLVADKTEFTLEEGITLLKSLPALKLNETVEASFNLGLDVRKSDQAMRGAVVLPHGTGKKVRVAVFTQGDKAKEAEEAGADCVGFQDLADDVKAGKMDFDVVIASPDAMPLVGKLGQILGPKGLMPNPKVGTVTPNVAEAVRNAKSGQVQFRTDKAGIIHGIIGKLDFADNHLIDNFKELFTAIKRAKPAGAKGVFLKKVTLSSTMGPGLKVDVAQLS